MHPQKLIDGKLFTLWPMLLTRQGEPFKDKRLIQNKSGQYLVGTYDTNGQLTKPAVVANGLYVGVTLPATPNILHVRKSPHSPIRPKTKDKRVMFETSDYRGHSSIAQGEPVIYAGELSFKEGELETWNNITGHYKFGTGTDYIAKVHSMHQTQYLKNDADGRLLPEGKMRAFAKYED